MSCDYVCMLPWILCIDWVFFTIYIESVKYFRGND